MHFITYLCTRIINMYSMDTENKTYLSVREAAEYIGYSTRYVYRLTALNVLPHYTPNGGRIFFKRVELDEWIATNGKQAGNARKGEQLIIR